MGSDEVANSLAVQRRHKLIAGASRLEICPDMGGSGQNLVSISLGESFFGVTGPSFWRCGYRRILRCEGVISQESGCGIGGRKRICILRLTAN